MYLIVVIHLRISLNIFLIFVNICANSRAVEVTTPNPLCGAVSRIGCPRRTSICVINGCLFWVLCMYICENTRDTTYSIISAVFCSVKCSLWVNVTWKFWTFLLIFPTVFHARENAWWINVQGKAFLWYFNFVRMINT